MAIFNMIGGGGGDSILELIEEGTYTMTANRVSTYVPISSISQTDITDAGGTNMDAYLFVLDRDFELPNQQSYDYAAHRVYAVFTVGFDRIYESLLVVYGKYYSQYNCYQSYVTATDYSGQQGVYIYTGSSSRNFYAGNYKYKLYKISLQ